MSHPEQIIGILALRDAGTLDWLAEAFGFTLHEVTPDGEGGLRHAQLRWGDGWLMASTQNSVGQHPGQASTYLTLATDAAVDAAYERARAAGAESVLAPEDQPYGGRGATVRDPEGNVWSVGSYRPGS